jgi:hypothetical protein
MCVHRRLDDVQGLQGSGGVEHGLLISSLQQRQLFNAISTRPRLCGLVRPRALTLYVWQY